MSDGYRAGNVIYNAGVLLLYHAYFWWEEYPHVPGEIAYGMLATAMFIFSLPVSVEVADIILIKRKAGRLVLVILSGLLVNYLVFSVFKRFYLSTPWS